MRTVGRVLGLAAAGLATLATLTACARPSYQFVGNDNHDLVMRLPTTWSQVNSDDVLRASGADPSTAVGWVAFYDGSSKPSVKHASNAYADAPLLIARSLDIPAESRAAVTGDALRDLLIPVTEEGRAQQQLAAAAAGQEAPVFKLIRDQALTTKTERGVHVLYSYTLQGHTEVYDKVAVTDPKLSRVHLALVHCSQTCFDARGKEIDQVVSSLTVKKS